jgi:hypothetical protein
MSYPNLQRREILPNCLAAWHVYGLVRLAGHRAGRSVSRARNAGVCGDLVLVVANGSLGDGADVLRASLQHVRVVGRQDRGRSADDGAETIVELLRLGLVDGLLEGRAGGGFVRGLGNVGVLVEVVVVVGGRAYNGASLTIDVEVNLRVIGREDAVGGTDDGAGGHDVCCVWTVGAECDVGECVVSGEKVLRQSGDIPWTDLLSTHFPRFTGTLWVFSSE